MPRWGEAKSSVRELMKATSQPWYLPGSLHLVQGGRRAAQWGRGCLRGVSPGAGGVRWLEALTRDLDP